MRFRCARCDSTEDDAVDDAVVQLSQQLVDYGHADHPHQPGSAADCFCPLPLDVASNGYLINITDDDDVSNR